jgi:hypothetical protein
VELHLHSYHMTLWSGQRQIYPSDTFKYDFVLLCGILYVLDESSVFFGGGGRLVYKTLTVSGGGDGKFLQHIGVVRLHYKAL